MKEKQCANLQTFSVLPNLPGLHKMLEPTLKIRQSSIWYAGPLGWWDKRLIVQASDVPSIFFHNFLQNSLQKSFQFIFSFFYKFTKIKIKSFECPKSIRNYEKNTAWNIRRLDNQSFVPSTQRITEGSRLMRISLLQFFKKIHKFALCEFMPYALGYFVSLVQFFWLFLLMCILAIANFFKKQKLH